MRQVERLFKDKFGREPLGLDLEICDFAEEYHEFKKKESTSGVSLRDVLEIYSLYPTKCPVSKRSTGKCTKDKTRIKTLIKNNSFKDVKFRIESYMKECIKDSVYFKNFSTLLNNLPEYEEEVVEQKQLIYTYKTIDGKYISNPEEIYNQHIKEGIVVKKITTHFKK